MKDQEVHEDEGQCSPIHGDILEEVFAHVPLVDLACASLVSKTWQFSVISSLSHVNKVKPWLIVQTQNKSSIAKNIRTHAYDPRSNSWVEICNLLPNPTNTISLLQSSGSNLFYDLSHKGLTFSKDPLHLTWHHVPPPSTWRVDPIVAVVGSYVIVAGGGPGLWDDPLTVEMYDMEASLWSTCQPMPSVLKDSAASSWLSVASNQHKMLVMEKASCATFSFSIETKTWSGPYNLRLDPSVYFSTIGFVGDDLILVGLLGYAQKVTSLKLWKINLEIMECDELGEMPFELLNKLKGEDFYILSSITLLATTDFIYIYNTSDPKEIIFCEFVDGLCKWGHAKNLVLDDDSSIREKMAMSCGRVEIANLHSAMYSKKNLKFVEIQCVNS